MFLNSLRINSHSSRKHCFSSGIAPQKYVKQIIMPLEGAVDMGIFEFLPLAVFAERKFVPAFAIINSAKYYDSGSPSRQCLPSAYDTLWPSKRYMEET